MTYKEAYITAFNEMDIDKEFTTKQIIERVEKIKSDGTTPQPSDFCYNITNKQFRNVYATHLHLFVQKENGAYRYLGPNALYKGVVTNKIQETGETVIVGEWIDGVYSDRKSAWLLTWNPENWEWKDDITETTWSCRSKGVKAGDTIYIIKVGEMPRGIMASGIATSEPYEEPHWDEDKRKNGLTTRSINVKFNCILNVEKDSYLDQNLLKNLFPDQDWSPMGSGISIREEYVNRLAEEWGNVVNQKSITKKYSVSDSVWIAAALLSYEKYNTIKNPNIIDMFLKQSNIKSRAQQLTDDTVDSARISWWCCADGEKHTYNYLRDVKDDSQTPWRRLTATNEMNREKECPQDLNEADLLKTSLGIITMGKLKNFVDNEYTDLVKRDSILKNDLSSMVIKVDKLLLKYNCYKETTNSDNEEEYYIRWNDTQETLLVFRVGLTSSVWQLNEKIQALANLDQDIYPIREVNLRLNRRVTFYDTQDSTMEAIDKLIIAAIKLKGYIIPDTTQPNKKEDNVMNKNIILYGPPGTGKTYNTAIYAVAICDGKSLQEVEDMGYEVVKERYNELMEKENRIAFTTFHQSYGYEEFIEGIRPVMDDEIDSNELQYKIVPGIFKAFCEKAKEEKIQASSLGIRENPVVWCVLLDGSGASQLKTRCFDNDYIKIGWTYVETKVTDQTKGITDQTRTMLTNFQDEMQEGDIVLIQAHNTSIDGIAIITGDYYFDEKDQEFPRTQKVKWIAKNINEDVLIINKNVRLNRKTIYPLKNMDVADVMKLVEKYSKSSITVEKNEKPYVFIIDEINRGNISKIFGELITLIEETKRLGEEEAMTAILPYSGATHPFGVPKNVYILGTMNTADRSIALMDTALRRRFNFVEMMPRDELLQDVIVKKNDIAVNVQKLLRDINNRIEFLFDREHTIGQAFFWGLKKEPTVERLGEIFKKSVVPLLQEYFYDDYEKIQLVLGDTGKTDDRYKFILNEEIAPNKIFRGRTNLEKEQKYKIQESAFNLIESYEGILNPEE